MCDKAHFERLEERVSGLEKSYATHAAISGEQLKTLFNSVRILFWIMVIFGGILLLTVVYGAVGARGFNHVTTTVKEFAPMLDTEK